MSVPRNGRSISDGLTPAIKKSPSSRGAFFVLTPYPLQRRRSCQEFPCSPFEDVIYPVNESLILLYPPGPLSLTTAAMESGTRLRAFWVRG